MILFITVLNIKNIKNCFHKSNNQQEKKQKRTNINKQQQTSTNNNKQWVNDFGKGKGAEKNDLQSPKPKKNQKKEKKHFCTLYKARWWNLEFVGSLANELSSASRHLIYTKFFFIQKSNDIHLSSSLWVVACRPLHSIPGGRQPRRRHQRVRIAVTCPSFFARSLLSH